MPRKKGRASAPKFVEARLRPLPMQSVGEAFVDAARPSLGAADLVAGHLANALRQRFHLAILPALGNC